MDIDLGLRIISITVTFFTGAAIAVFAWLTYRHTQKVTELRFAPVLEINPIGPPDTGSFSEEKHTYHGVKWEISLINPGDIPILARDISVYLQVSPTEYYMEGVWTGIGKLCDLVDEEGNVLSERAIGVNGHNQRRITVYVCREDKRRREEHKLFRPGDKAALSIEAHQTRGLGKGSGWAIVERSEIFEMPERLEKEIHIVRPY